MTNRSTVVSGVAAELIAHAETLGLDGPALRRRYGLPAGVESDFERHIPAQTLLRMWREVPAQAGDPDFGLHMAERFARPFSNLATLLIASAPTVEHGIESYMERQAAFNQFRPTQWVRGAEGGQLVIDTRGLGLEFPRAALDFALAWWWLLIQRSLAGSWAPSRVEFAYARPARPREHTRVFGRVPLFGQARNVLALPEELLRTPLATMSPQLATVGQHTAGRLVERHKAELSVGERAQAWMREALVEGRRARIEEAAPKLGMSVRTLQRQLGAERRSWSALYDEVRAELAKAWILEGALSTTEVAERLGFSDAAGFFRAFRRWTGQAPSAFRAHARVSSEGGTTSSSKGSSGS